MKRRARRFAAGLRSRSILRRLAGHASAQLRQPGHAGSHDRRAARKSPDSATACAATWRCWCCRKSSNGPGASRLSRSGRRRPSACASGSRTSASWPRFTGIWNGRFSSRASITPTTSGSTTASAMGTPGRCASTFTPGSTIRTSSRVSWKTTTSRAPRPLSRRTSTRRRRCSPSSRRACGSFIRANSRDARSASRRIWAAARMNP